MINILFNIFLIIILVMVYAFLKKRWQSIDLFDIYIISVAVYFGVYSLVDSLFNNLSNYNLLLIIWTHLLVFITTAIMWLCTRLLPNKVRRFIELRYLIEILKKTTLASNVLFFLFIIIITLYTYFKYGILGKADLSLLNDSLPYSLVSIRNLVPSIAYMLCLTTIIKLKSNAKLNFKYILWAIMLLGSLFIIFIYGRRMFFGVLLLQILIFSILANKNIFKMKNSKNIMILAIVMMLASNIFQNYRSIIYSVNSNSSNVPGFSESILSFDKTTDNLKDRTAIWRFNYLITEKHLKGNLRVSEPGITVAQGFANAIPSFLLPSKSIYDLDSTVALGASLPILDYPSNLYAYLEFDFGYLSIFMLTIIFLPIMIILIILLIATKSHPILFAFVACNIINNLMNVETTYSFLLIMLRDSFFVTSIYTILYLIYIKPLLKTTKVSVAFK